METATEDRRRRTAAAPERRCPLPGCGTPLSSYNPNHLCWLHALTFVH